VTAEREDDLEYLMAFVDQTFISRGALLLHVADHHIKATHRSRWVRFLDAGSGCPPLPRRLGHDCRLELGSLPITRRDQAELTPGDPQGRGSQISPGTGR